MSSSSGGVTAVMSWFG
jgi:hypothetical protein